MLILEMLVALFAVLVIMFLIQYRSYNNSQKIILCADIPRSKEYGTTCGEPAGLQLALKEEVTVTV